MCYLGYMHIDAFFVSCYRRIQSFISNQVSEKHVQFKRSTEAKIWKYLSQKAYTTHKEYWSKNTEISIKWCRNLFWFLPFLQVFFHACDFRWLFPLVTRVIWAYMIGFGSEWRRISGTMQHRYLLTMQVSCFNASINHEQC